MALEHCAGDEGCYLQGKIISHGEVMRELDRALSSPPAEEGIEKITYYLRMETLRAKARLTAAWLEEKFPKTYLILASWGLPRPYH